MLPRSSTAGGPAAEASGVLLAPAPRWSPSVIEDPAGTCSRPVPSRTSDSTEFFVKRTYQPKARRRSRKHGFRHRMSDRAGQAIIKARRRKGRQRLSA